MATSGVKNLTSNRTFIDPLLLLLKRPRPSEVAKIDAMGLGRPSGPCELFTRHAAHDVWLFVCALPS